MIELQLSNQIYQGFTDITVTRDIECLSGSFRFETTTLQGGSFPISRGEPCKVFINGIQQIDGFVDEINVDYDSTSRDSSSHQITITGRDKTSDIIDSTIDATIELKTPITLVNVIKHILSYLNIKDMSVIDNVGDIEPFTKSELVSGQIGQKAFDFLDQFCVKRQVLLTTDGQGNIIITRGNGTKTNAQLIGLIDGSDNNIKKASVKYDDSKRYNKYVIRSQGNISALDQIVSQTTQSGQLPPDIITATSQNITTVKGSSIDSGVRNTRLLVINSEKSSNLNETVNRAQWERDIRRARAINYLATVNGYTNQDGNLWEPLQLIRVQDDFCGVNDTLIIRKVEYMVSVANGQITKLDLVPKETFLLLSEEASKKKKHNKKKKTNAITQQQINQVKFELSS